MIIVLFNVNFSTVMLGLITSVLFLAVTLSVSSDVALTVFTRVPFTKVSNTIVNRTL